jgi:hypothetical protein
MKNAVLSLTLSLIAQSGFATPITVLSNSTVARAWDSDVIPSSQQDTFSATAVPSSENLTASRGSSSSTADASMTGSDSSFEYDISIQHAIDNSTGKAGPDYAETVVSVLNFLASENATYTLSGLYEVGGASALEASVESYLYDLTASSFLFLDTTRSRNLSGSASFHLGDVGDGNYMNDTNGSLTGNLLAGHQYYFSLNARIINRSSSGYNSASGAASGRYALEVGSATAPEPGVLGLLGASLLGLGLTRRRRAG